MFRTVRRNILVILAGNGTAAAMGFFTLAFNSRALGPEGLGVLALLQAFFALLVQFFNFDVWQVVVRFGVEAQEAGDPRRLRGILGLACLYDALAALVAGLTGVLVVLLLLPLFGLGPEHRGYALAFALAALLSFSSGAKGVLRLFDRQAWLAVLQVSGAGLTLAASALFYAASAPFWAYVALYAGLPPVISLLSWAMVARLWRREGLSRPDLASLRDPGLRREFARSAWAMGTLGSLNALRQNADAFALAALLGPAAVGHYKVANQLANLVARLGDPLTMAMYREVTVLAVRRDWALLRPVILRSVGFGLLAAAVVTGAALALGDVAVRVAAGPAFADAALPLAWLALAQGLVLNQFYARPLVLALRGPGTYLLATLLGLVVFVPALLFAVPAFGAPGAGAAQAAYHAVWLSICLAVISRELRTGRAG